MTERVLAVLIIVCWIFLCFRILWDAKKPVLVNLVMSALVYALMGLFYILPFWLLFME